MKISLPDPLKEFVDSQIESGRYESVDAYVHELIRNDEKLKAEQALEAMLLEGLDSEELPSTPAQWQAIRGSAQARLQALKSSR